MSLEDLVDADFSRALRRARLRQVRIRLRRDNVSDGLLLCLDDLKMIPRAAVGRTDRGTRTVPVAQIGGSVGRCSEFDRDFMPAKAGVKERWKRIDRAFHRGEELPPVRLYKVGGFYFVLDGRHRISVASYHGVKWIDAFVTEFNSGLWSDLKDGNRRIPDDSDFRAGQRNTQRPDYDRADALGEQRRTLSR
jgi:hypothetical protein